MTGDGYVTAIVKRLGEERFFSGAFGVFRHISAIFCVFCLVVKINFVYLQSEWGAAIICIPELLNVNKLKMSRKVLNLNLLRPALRKIVMKGGDAKVMVRDIQDSQVRMSVLSLSSWSMRWMRY